MGETIFRKLRYDDNGMEKYISTKDGEVVKLTQTKLAEILGIDNGTLSNYECGKTLPSYDVLKKYHEELNVPYETLFGEGGIAMQKANVQISQDLGLSDNAINTIRQLSPTSLTMLNAFISNYEYTDIFMLGLYKYLEDMSYYKNQKDSKNKIMLKYLLTESFTDYAIEIVTEKLSNIFQNS